MFDLDPSKLIVIGVVALIVIPSKDLPRVLRTLGQTSARLRSDGPGLPRSIF
jgi:sec-independent protein translocase protein TatB